MNLSLINGVKGSIPVTHRALAYGDGVFETIRVVHNKPEFLKEHLRRLKEGCMRLGLNWSDAQQADLVQSITSLCTNITKPHVLKIMLLRNFEGRGYGYSQTKQKTDLTLEIAPYETNNWRSSGVRVGVSKISISENKTLAGIKHLNRLDSVLAKQDCIDSQFDEVLMLDQHKNIIEGSISNLFVKVNGQWLTPSIDKAGVDGIIRRLLLKAFPDIEKTLISVDDINKISSAFICNSLIGICPLLSIANVEMQEQTNITLFENKIGYLSA